MKAWTRVDDWGRAHFVEGWDLVVSLLIIVWSFSYAFVVWLVVTAGSQ